MTDIRPNAILLAHSKGGRFQMPGKNQRTVDTGWGDAMTSE
jgi:hypothetical protein